MRLHHVSIPFALDGLAEGRRFYGETLELEEIPRPETLFGDGAWYRLGDRELHLFIDDDPNADEGRRHYCFEVDDLENVRQRLVAAGTRIEEATPIKNRPRFYAFDPAGNMLELTQIVGDYRP